MRKFILNPAVIGAAFGVLGPIRASRKGPRDWRLALVWAGWGITMALAVGGVIEEQRAIERGDSED